ncbi:MAG: phosphonate metabolism transcriptional regulator PhnF [Noviherbaspirillum sp.]
MGEASIVREAGMTMWRQIQKSLTADILAGKLSGKLPNEMLLAEQFSVNRHTVRQAVKALAEQGIVEVMHGRGTFVRDDLLDYKLGRRTRLAHSVTKARRVGNSQLLACAPVRPSPEIADLLSLPARAKVLKVDSLDSVDGKVIGVCTQYFPLPRFEGFGEIYENTGKTHLALAKYGITHFQRKLSRISARLPGSEVAQQLAQPASLPILYVETVYVDEQDQPIEYGISRFSSAAVQLVIEPD